MPNNETKVIKWWKDLKDLANSFYKKIIEVNSEFKDFIEYDEKAVDRIIEDYKIYRDLFQGLIRSEHIDRHKTLAGIMLAATDKKNIIFRVDDDAIRNSTLISVPYFFIYPNEYFLCKILVHILTDCVLATKKSAKYSLNKENYSIRFPNTIVRWEEKIIEPYENQFCKLLYTLREIDDKDTKCSLLASHLIFFYELAYDCAVKRLSRVYYTPAV